jgi:hypothetical protein
MRMFEWEKKGQLFDPEKFDWKNTHGQVPFFVRTKNKNKVFFTSRPPKNADGTYVSFIHAVDIDVSNGHYKVDHLYDKPLLPLGEIGCFDEFGTMPCSIVNHPTKNEVWMYYVGWSRKVSSPYDCAIGLAISKDDGQTFTKASNGPLIGANLHDPFVLGCPRVYIFDNVWYMFYLAGIKWLDFNGRKECFYKLKIAKSHDGINWERNDRFIIPERYEDECQTCATVFQAGGLYHMYFTYRHSIDFRNPERGYRVGYASSPDLQSWTRNDETGNFNTSGSGWDSEMICYPNVSRINDKLVMFYCGNSFGLHGFGYAQLKNS